MSNYKCVLFDWDGTIVQSLDIWLYCLKKELLKYGYELTDKQIGANYEQFRVRAPSLGIINVDDILQTVYATIDIKMHDVLLNKGVVELLSALKHHDYKIGLVTTSQHSQVQLHIDKFGLGEFFDVVVCGDDVRNQKPNPEPGEFALKTLECLPSETLMVGDSDTDIVFAQNLNVDSVLFHPHRYDTFYDYRKLMALRPTYVVSNLGKIDQLLFANI